MPLLGPRALRSPNRTASALLPSALLAIAMLAITTTLAGCRTEQVLPPGRHTPGDPVRLVVPGFSALEQVVRVSPATPAPGDTLTFRSVLRNFGDAPVHTESTICHLQLRGELQRADPFGRCAGYSRSGALASGDSIVESDWRVVVAEPGTYRVEVRHLLVPSVWLPLYVEVRPR